MKWVTILSIPSCSQENTLNLHSKIRFACSFAWLDPLWAAKAAWAHMRQSLAFILYSRNEDPLFQFISTLPGLFSNSFCLPSVPSSSYIYSSIPWIFFGLTFFVPSPFSFTCDVSMEQWMEQFSTRVRWRFGQFGDDLGMWAHPLAVWCALSVIKELMMCLDNLDTLSVCWVEKDRK